MSKIIIATVVGSLRQGSFNKRLATALESMAPADFDFTRIRIDDLPLYDQDDDTKPADAVKRIKREIVGAHGVLFVTPEYNRSMPGVLKNAIDHASRPYGESVWTGKPAGVIGASIGSMGTAMAQQHLRNTLAYLDMPVMGQPEAFVQVDDSYFDAQGGITSDRNRKFLQKWMDRFAEFVRQHAKG